MPAVETPLDAMALVEHARSVRLAYALGRTPEETPVALEMERRKKMQFTLKGQKDPSEPGKDLSIGMVWASFEPDERGLLEVLVTTTPQVPFTAFVKGTQVAYVVEGW